MKLKVFAVVILLACLFPVRMAAAEPEGNLYLTPERLFHISRSVNRNLVCYDVNLVDGKLDEDEPLNVYWVNREERMGEKNGLNFFQRKMAYGYKVVSRSENSYVCSLAAYPDRKLTIAKKGTDYVCYITINNQRSILRTLYVDVSPKNPLNVHYVELRGVSAETGQPLTERIMK